MRVIAWISVLAIVVLSVVPGHIRPHTGLPGRVEHFMAYAGAGFLFGLGYLRWEERLSIWIGLSVVSGILEVIQEFVPDRSPSPLDALASICGLTLGWRLPPSAILP